MLDKQKLIQWIEDKRYVWAGPYDSELDKLAFLSKLIVLNLIKQQIELGEFDK